MTWRIFDCPPCDCRCGGGACCVERADPCSTAVEDRSAITVEGAREEIGIPASVTDARIARWLSAAKQSADRFLANGFCGGAIPEAVELGILAYVSELYRGAAAGDPALAGRRIASQSVGGVSISYEGRADAGGAPSNDAEAAAAGWWGGYRALTFARLGGCTCGGCRC